MTASQKIQAEQEVSHQELANSIRFLSMDAVEKAKSGHPGMPMGMADVATVLFKQFLKFDPENPLWPDRDRFVLSAGHGSMLLYSLLYLTGYADITLDEIKNFRQKGARTAGHPEYGHAAGIETTTGPLGQGIANAVGMAMAEKLQAARFGNLINHHTYVIAGDGCLMEGISQEAISMAGHLKLNKLIVLWDDNKITIDGRIEIASSEDQIARFKAAGWNTIAINGHDYFAITESIAKAKASDKPTLIACDTKIGYGAPTKQGTEHCHGSPLGASEIEASRQNLKWAHAAFDVPQNVLNEWRGIGAKGAKEFAKWNEQLAKLDKVGRAEFLRMQSGELPDIAEILKPVKQDFIAKKPGMATRNSSKVVLDALTAALPELIGGSADLTGSNGTKTNSYKAITPTDFSGNYIHYGIREHAMQAAMNGISLHGGFVPYGGTFLVFSDYARPSLRLAALMGIRNVFVGTHDSIGLGEDGPTHQPVEHLSALRAIPNLYVFRPADEVEVAECWEAALSLKTAPSVMSLTRQNLPTLRGDAIENKSARGGYIISKKDGAKATIIATGSEVSIAVAAQNLLSVPVNVVSMPCLDLFEQQDAAYQNEVLGTRPIAVVEAGIRQSWDKYLGRNGLFFGVETFGASAPYQELYKQFGLTPENIAEKVGKAVK